MEHPGQSCAKTVEVPQVGVLEWNVEVQHATAVKHDVLDVSRVGRGAFGHSIFTLCDLLSRFPGICRTVFGPDQLGQSALHAARSGIVEAGLLFSGVVRLHGNNDFKLLQTSNCA